MSETVTIEIRDNGPYRVTGPVRIVDQDGNEVAHEGDVVKLCRCGASATKPFCDGEHSRIGFQAAQRALDAE
ncbi:MAG: CDGSH iron-sulfur domain-containing protein [Thermoleophilia bacterium]|nr:CDGSH iron-sulfur domain-containing protein [Thermoleophilia bacterium]